MYRNCVLIQAEVGLLQKPRNPMSYSQKHGVLNTKYIKERWNQYGTKNAWLSYGENEEKEMEQIAKSYKSFLDAGKTERECVTELTDRQRLPAMFLGGSRSLHQEKISLRQGDKWFTLCGYE